MFLKYSTNAFTTEKRKCHDRLLNNLLLLRNPLLRWHFELCLVCSFWKYGTYRLQLWCLRPYIVHTDLRERHEIRSCRLLTPALGAVTCMLLFAPSACGLRHRAPRALFEGGSSVDFIYLFFQRLNPSSKAMINTNLLQRLFVLRHPMNESRFSDNQGGSFDLTWAQC